VARRLILDTSVLVTAERAGLNLGRTFGDDDDIVIAAITVAELRAGIELGHASHRASRTTFLARILESLPVEPYDLRTAEVHGQLLAHARAAGRQRGAHDTVIAATAISTQRTLVTADKAARFHELPGLQCVLIS
jgi:tRNA(fMet)-specific endonuclease VapC